MFTFCAGVYATVYLYNVCIYAVTLSGQVLNSECEARSQTSDKN